jgi:hypothetical protein
MNYICSNTNYRTSLVETELSGARIALISQLRAKTMLLFSIVEKYDIKVGYNGVNCVPSFI